MDSLDLSNIRVPDLLFKETDFLIDYISPSSLSNLKRRGIDAFVKETIRRSFPTDCFLSSTGSFPLRSYLPESDLDLVLVRTADSQQESSVILSVFNSLCQTIVDGDSEGLRDNAFVIRNVEFRNARTKLAHCIVNNLDVDITVNQINALESNLLLEEADRAIGKTHLFKRSLLLLKAWCTHESAKYCGVSILGSKDGMFSSYALSVMVLHIFRIDERHKELLHPFLVLRYFLKFYSTFQWSRYVLTLNGPVSIASGNQKPDFLSNTDKFGDGDMFGSIVAKLRRHKLRAKQMSMSPQPQLLSAPFPLRCCNIVDPVNEVNNLGFNVAKDCLERIDVALKGGHHHLETLVRMINLACRPMKVAPTLSSSHNAPNRSPSAFVPPTGGFAYPPQYSSLYVAGGSGAGIGGLPPAAQGSMVASRPRAESASAIGNSGSADTVDSSTLSNTPVTGGTEYLTVFFAQARVRYVINAGCRHDLLDHPKQKGSFFMQLGHHDSTTSHSNSSRPVSSIGVVSRSEPRGSFPSADPLSGNLAEMWEEYGQIIEYMINSFTHTKEDAEQKNIFSALSPDSVDLSENLSSGSKGDSDIIDDGIDLSSPICCEKGDTYAGVSETTPPPLLLDTVAMKDDIFRLENSDSTINVEASSSDVTTDPEESYEGLPSTSKSCMKKVQSKMSKIGARVQDQASSNQEDSTPDQQRAEDDRNEEPINLMAKVEIIPPKKDDLKFLCAAKQSIGTLENISCDHFTERVVTEPLSFRRKIAAAMSLVLCLFCFILAKPDIGAELQSSVFLINLSDFWNLSLLRTESSNPDPEISLTANAQTFLKCEISAFYVVLILRFLLFFLLCYTTVMEMDSEIRKGSDFSKLIHWVTKGSNVSFSANNDIISAHAEVLRKSFEYSAAHRRLDNTAVGEEDIDLDNQSYSINKLPILMFAWYKHGVSSPKLVCLRHPCSLSIYNIESEDEGQYQLMMSEEGASINVSVPVLNVVIRVSEPPRSLSKPVYLTLGLGSSLYLHIKAEGNPEPSLQWFKNGFSLAGQNRAVLHIPTVNKFDEGTYTCELSNIAGSYIWQEGAVSVRSVVPPSHQMHQ